MLGNGSISTQCLISCGNSDYGNIGFFNCGNANSGKLNFDGWNTGYGNVGLADYGIYTIGIGLAGAYRIVIGELELYLLTDPWRPRTAARHGRSRRQRAPVFQTAEARARSTSGRLFVRIATPNLRPGWCAWDYAQFAC